MTRQKTAAAVKVWDIEEMGYLVRGTLDRRQARLAAWRKRPTCKG